MYIFSSDSCRPYHLVTHLKNSDFFRKKRGGRGGGRGLKSISSVAVGWNFVFPIRFLFDAREPCQYTLDRAKRQVSQAKLSMGMFSWAGRSGRRAETMVHYKSRR